MKEMKAVEFESTGADVMSRFHQLSGGKRGKGPGNAPLATGPTSVAAESLRLAASVTRASRTRRPVTSRRCRLLFRDDKDTSGGYPRFEFKKRTERMLAEVTDCQTQNAKSFFIKDLY